eukprot:1376191-Lingulodinium_polyedra.AAC.1
MQFLHKSKPAFVNPALTFSLLSKGWSLNAYVVDLSVTQEELAAKKFDILVLAMMGFVVASRGRC